MTSTWGYTGSNGPLSGKWDEVAPAGKGTHQSPIDIDQHQAEFDESLSANPLQYSYTPNTGKTITNTGVSWLVDVDGNGTSLQGGPTENKYELLQFHLHWGKDSQQGSEHRINGKMYAAELHLVHWNKSKYKDVTEAFDHPDGLCVLGIFLQEGKEHNGFKVLTDVLKTIPNKDQKAEFKNGLDPANLLPENTKDYWTYQGSLTTPPLCECVTWVVFQDPIEVSSDQLNTFRNLMQNCHGEEPVNDEFKGHIVNNYRPPLPLNDRKLRASFKAATNGTS